MTSHSFRLPTMVRRPLRYTWVLGLGLLIVSVAGTGWMLNTQAADKAPKSGAEDSNSQQRLVANLGKPRGSNLNVDEGFALNRHVYNQGDRHVRERR